MLKKTWNLSTLGRVMKENQDVDVKSTISIKLTKDSPALEDTTLQNNSSSTVAMPDLIFTHMELVDTRQSSHLFHRISFICQLSTKTNSETDLRIRILDTDYNVLADGICRLTKTEQKEQRLSLSFYTEKTAIRLEIFSFNMKRNDIYVINKIIQESYTRDQVLDLFLDNVEAQKLLESVLEDDDTLKNPASLGKHYLWSYIKELSSSLLTGKDFIVKSDLNSEMRRIHRELFVLNRGNLLVNSLMKKEGKDLAAILLWNLRIDEHYKSFINLKKPNEHKEPKEPKEHKESVNNGLVSLRSREKSIVENLANLKEKVDTLLTDIRRHEDNVVAATKIRATIISDIRLLESSRLEMEARKLQETGMDRSRDSESNIGKELDEKKKILVQLKAHLMKELLRQNNLKRVSEIFIQLIGSYETDLGDDNLFVETIKNYKNQIMSVYNLIGQDLHAIEDELTNIQEDRHIQKVKERVNETEGKNGEKTEEKHAEKATIQDRIMDNEKRSVVLKSEVEDITNKINDTNKKIGDIKRVTSALEVRRSAIFYALVEILLETRLNELYTGLEKEDDVQLIHS